METLESSGKALWVLTTQYLTAQQTFVMMELLKSPQGCSLVTHYNFTKTVQNFLKCHAVVVQSAKHINVGKKKTAVFKIWLNDQNTV